MLQVLQVSLPATFPRMTYAEAVAKYGTDKPDLRYDLQLHDVTQAVKDSEFRWAAPVGCSCGTSFDRRACRPLERALQPNALAAVVLKGGNMTWPALRGREEAPCTSPRMLAHMQHFAAH